MLHIILGILKVIGILLLAIIGLILLMVLALLFVPVQYRFAGKKLEKVLEGRAAVSWLFRIIGLTVDYSGQQMVIRLKLLGFTLKSFGNNIPPKEKKKKTGRNKRKKKKTQASGKFPEEWEPLPEGEPNEPETLPQGEGDTLEPLPESEADQPEALPESELDKSNSACENEEPQAKEPEKGPVQQGLVSLIEQIVRFIERIAGILGRILSFLFSIPERILDFWGKLWDAADGVENAVDRLIKKKDELYKMAEPFLTDASKALYRRIIGHLLYLWKHYRPRKIQGWMRYGTGAPDVTGQLTGVLYLLLPSSANQFELLTEFAEKTFEADITIKGRIRACHLIKVAFLLWRDKQLRRLIRRIRAKGGK